MIKKKQLLVIAFLFSFIQIFAQAPVITDPSDQTVDEGQTATFFVTRISGTEPFSYQWQLSVSGTGFDWTNISGATLSSYTTVPTTLAMDGYGYRCVVSNDSGIVNSALALLNVNALPPQITSQPTDQSIYVGETATFSVVATSSIAMTYQWYADGAPISGATNSSYTTETVVDLTPDGTIYYCIVSNASGSVQSDNAVLNVSVAPGRITDGLQVLYDFQEGEGTTITDVSGVGSPYNLTISNLNAVNWTNDGLDIINTSDIKASSPASKIINACKASNELTIELWLRPADVVQGEKTARIVTLAGNKSERNFVVAQPYAVYDIPVRTTETDLAGHPQTWGEDAVSTSLTHLVYTRQAEGIATLYINGVEYVSTSSGGDFSNWDNSYILGIANEIGDPLKSWEGSFYLLAIYSKALEPFEIEHNFSESVPLTSEFLTMKMNPRYQGALVGESKEFRVGAVGKLPMTYQWQVDEGSGFVNIPGATSSFYRTPSLTTADNRNDYRCRVTNDLGTITSNFATLYVTPSSSKVTINKQVEYSFQEGSGTVVNDVSGLGTPLNLSIQESGNVEWTPYGLSVTGPAGIVSVNPATKLIDASLNSHEFSFEAWIKPSEGSLTKNSRITTIAQNENTRNFYFAQNNDSYELRSRITTNVSGSNSLESDPGTVNTSELVHIAYTINEFGIRRMFINGEIVESGHEYGNITNWDNTFNLAIGSDVDNTYSWEGLINYAAFYGRGLSPTEISHNYSFGVEGGIPTVSLPTNLTVASSGAEEIGLSWSDNSDNEDGFLIERSVGDSLSYVAIDSVASNVTSYSDQNISEATVYFYRVKAFNVVAQSEYSNEISVTSLLKTPTNLQAQAQVFGEIILRWDENSSAEEGVIVERGEGDPLVYTILDTLESNINSYFDTTVEELKEYTYRVKVFNSLSSSDYSEVATITSLFADVNTPTELSIELHPVRGVPVLSWTDNSDNEDGFIIERKIAGADYSIIDTVDADTVTYLDISVEENTIYLYRIMAFNQNTVSDYSNVVDVNVLTSVENLEIPTEYSLSQNYPNPFNPSTTIKFGLPQESRVNLVVYNLLGQQVLKALNREFSAGRHEFILDGSKLTSGIYIYTLTAQGIDGDDFASTKKMILLK